MLVKKKRAETFDGKLGPFLFSTLLSLECVAFSHRRQIEGFPKVFTTTGATLQSNTDQVEQELMIT